MDELVMSPRAFNFPPHGGKAHLQKQRHDVIKINAKEVIQKGHSNFRKGFFEIQVIISYLQCFTQILVNGSKFF